jgi:hypothetical protein
MAYRLIHTAAAQRRFTAFMAMIGEMWKGSAFRIQQAKILDEFLHMPQSASA